VEDPTITYAPGDLVFFKWQQNYNHYEAGYPGKEENPVKVTM